jgi:hypothetical protein
MTTVTFLQDFQTGKTLFKIGDEVEDDLVRFFIGLINDSHDLCFIDKTKPWTVKNKNDPMAVCAIQGNYGVSAYKLRAIHGIKEEHMTHTINSTQTAAVATDYYWIPISADTPHGVKLQLLGQGGVAQYSSYHGDPFWTHWCPLPKRRD